MIGVGGGHAKRAWLAAAGWLVLASWPAGGQAQAPTPDQVSAIRRACRTDYGQFCAAVPTGGMAALSCLQENRARLSAACAGALPGTAAPAETAETARAGGGDAVWPHTIEAGGARVTVYEPQALSWPDRAKLTARAAVSVSPAQGAPFLGTVEVAGDTSVDPASRQVTISHLKLLATHFPTLDTRRAAFVDSRIGDAVAGLADKRLPLDTVLLSLGAAGTSGSAVSEAVSNVPPSIVASRTPALLVVFDGAPVMAPVAETTVQRALNADATVLRDGTERWFLERGGHWWSAAGADGPWAPAGAVPNEVGRAAGTAAAPGAGGGVAADARVIVSTVPAELIETDGAPSYAPVPGTGLRRVTNTASVLYRDRTGTFYYLSSGRWFSAPDLSGPWVFATPDLPADFSRINPRGLGGQVLAAVPGTAEAQSAVLRAGLPQMAALSRTRTVLTVTYVGAPVFVPVPGTALRHAVNASAAVIAAGGRYYACANGAWFVSRAPTGPWVLATAVPAAIYAIPPSSPLYPLTFVRVYAVTPAAVTYGYTAGYALGFVSAGVLVYGTGYSYPPVVIAGPVPAYYPFPRTYVGGATYVASTGAWARGGAVYGASYGAAGFNAYNAATGASAHGTASWGPYGGTANANFSNPSTGRSGSTQQNANAYGRWGSSTLSAPNGTVHTQSASNARGAAGGFSASNGAAGAGVHGAAGRNAGVVKGAGGNVYAGANGNVYRHTDDGWSKWSHGGWNGVSASGRQNGRSGWGAEQQGLERDRFARTQGGGYQRGGGRFRR